METLTVDSGLQETIVAALGQCPLFRALKPELLPQLLKAAEAVRFEPGEAIIQQGDPSDSFLVLIEGEAAVVGEKASGDKMELGRIPKPSSVGEVGLLLGEPRTATVAAATAVVALRFGAKAFEAMFQKIPNFGLGLSAGLAYRLQQVSGRVPLPEYDVAAAPPSPEVVSVLPFEFVQRHRVVPLKQEGNVLTLGLVDDPSSQVLRSVHEQVPGVEIHPVRVSAQAFGEVLRAHGGVAGWRAAPAAPEAAAAQPRAPKLDPMLERVVAEGASDLHLSPGHKPHWRIDGDIQEIADAASIGPDHVLELLSPVLSPRHRTQFAEEHDTDFAYAIPGLARFRVNMFRDANGVGAVFRQIPSKILTFEQLGLPAVLKDLCGIPKGLILVTGPTGSGKSTTLAAMIDHINKTRRAHIITVEDPIEFVHKSQASLVNQREIGGHTRSFSRALRAALREDPDIILVGELRDRETVALALEAANTGHLVFATLHTNTAVTAVDRVVDQFPAEEQAQARSVLSEVMRGVVAQTLCKRMGGGRLAALEVLIVNYAVANLIREAKTVQITSIMQSSRAQGMSLLNDELMRLVEGKKIELSEAMAAAVDKPDMARRFRSGVTLAAEPPALDRFRVIAVTAGSPGAEAGLTRGDLIVEIAGKPSNTYSLDEVRQLFRSDGKHLLTVDRGGKRRPVTLELKRAL
jgi:twitching motility protein PilT